MKRAKKRRPRQRAPRAAADPFSAHRLADLELHPSTDPSADGPIRLDTELIWDHPDPTGDEWRLALTTRFGTENEQKPAPYNGKVQIIGSFQIDPKWPKPKPPASSKTKARKSSSSPPANCSSNSPPARCMGNLSCRGWGL